MHYYEEPTIGTKTLLVGHLLFTFYAFLLLYILSIAVSIFFKSWLPKIIGTISTLGIFILMIPLAMKNLIEGTYAVYSSYDYLKAIVWLAHPFAGDIIVENMGGFDIFMSVFPWIYGNVTVYEYRPDVWLLFWICVQVIIMIVSFSLIRQRLLSVR